MRIAELPIVALDENTVLPYAKMNLDISDGNSLDTIKNAIEQGKSVFFVKKIFPQVKTTKDICKVGTVATIRESTWRKNIFTITVEGLYRAKLNAVTSFEPLFCGESEELEYTGENSPQISNYLEVLNDLVVEYSKYTTLPIEKNVLVQMLKGNFEINSKINAVVAILDHFDRQKFLEEDDIVERLKSVCVELKRNIQKIEIIKQIEIAVDADIRGGQKDFVLREQLKIIKQELGDDNREFVEMKKKIDNLHASQEIKDKLNLELERCQRIPQNVPEYSLLRTYFDVVLSLPWGTYTEDNYDLEHIRQVLDDEHYGLVEVKERIVEYIAVKKLSNDKKAPIICLSGAPGVGKTSIAQSIAKALGKEYINMSLGGIHDEAEIRGHRKTYVGAMCGRILSCMTKAKSNNPLFLLDEIDKLSSDIHGDPSSALLEVLDPKQNAKFRDNYLELPYDLSKVFFIMTANNLANIQKPLLDRMEVIEISSYTVEEKCEIAMRYLVPKQIKEHGLDCCEVEFTRASILEIIESYTNEAGVRELERTIEKICRKISTEIVGGNNISFEIKPDNLEKFIGVKKYVIGEDIISSEVGAVNGLAWTSNGGVVMPIEVKLLPSGKGEIILTGRLGDVMKESAMIAVSLIKVLAKKINIDSNIFAENNIHIHVPEGATPKDGPSAGITLATAILSAVIEKPIHKSLAMTGELTLRGKVLAIGGLKEKLLAAQRNGIKTVIIPLQNKRNVAEIPDTIKNNMTLIYADNIVDVFNNALDITL